MTLSLPVESCPRDVSCPLKLAVFFVFIKLQLFFDYSYNLSNLRRTFTIGNDIHTGPVTIVLKKLRGKSWKQQKKKKKKNETPNTHMHDCSISRLGTSTSVKSGSVKLESWIHTSTFSETLSPISFFYHM